MSLSPKGEPKSEAMDWSPGPPTDEVCLKWRWRTWTEALKGLGGTTGISSSLPAEVLRQFGSTERRQGVCSPCN